MLFTTPTDKPLVNNRQGWEQWSTDASTITKNGEISLHVIWQVRGKHVTMLIDKELGLNTFDLAEDIKKYPCKS